jgi:drug/metabolite transporter (DMT)-like permease
MGETLRVAATDVPAVPAVLELPPTADLATMVVAIAAVSTSGPIVVATAASALAIAFWRTTMASGVLLPWTLLRNRRELLALSRRELTLGAVAGLLLAAHFATWVPSLRYTTVASSTGLVATQPIWAAFLARRSGAVIPGRAWLGIAAAVLGAAVITGVDVHASLRSLGGDLLALAGAMFAAAYMAAGGEVRRSVSTATYTTICYLTTAVALLVVCVIGGQSLGPYDGDVWLKLAGLTVGAQLLGHSLFNHVLRRTSPTIVSLAILFEVPGASLIAAVWLHQQPHAAAIPGLALLLVGVALITASRDRAAEPTAPAE